MDQDKYVAMASLDLSAAFDVVNVGNKNKETALQRLQKVQNWLKVNVEKPEIVIFYKTDTATTSIKLKEIEVHTKKQMSVLRVIFDSKLE